MPTSSEPVRIELIVCYIWIQFQYMGIVWSLCLSLTLIISSGVGGTVSCRWVRPWHFWCHTCCVSVVLSFVSWSIRCKIISLELCHLQSEVSWTPDHFLGGNIYRFHCKSLYYTQYLFSWLAFPLLAWISRLRLFLIPLLFSVVIDNGELDSGSWQRTWCVRLHSEVGWHCKF